MNGWESVYQEREKNEDLPRKIFPESLAYIARILQDWNVEN